MNAQKVDVLAVMDMAARRLGAHSKMSGDGDDQLSSYLGHEARAGVAELIEAAQKLADFPTSSRRDRVHAILANIGSTP